MWPPRLFDPQRLETDKKLLLFTYRRSSLGTLPFFQNNTILHSSFVTSGRSWGQGLWLHHMLFDTEELYPSAKTHQFGALDRQEIRMQVLWGKVAVCRRCPEAWDEASRAPVSVQRLRQGTEEWAGSRRAWKTAHRGEALQMFNLWCGLRHPF